MATLLSLVGALSRSEFTGCGRVLVGALPVNPWQQPQLVAAIHNALTMPQREKMSRYIANMEVLIIHTYIHCHIHKHMSAQRSGTR